MNVLSPKVVIERLTLPVSTLVNLKEGFKKCFDSTEAVAQNLSSLKRLQSKNVRPLPFSGKSHYNQQFFDKRSQTPVSGQRGHVPQKPLILVDSWAPRNRSHGGITKKSNHEAVSLGKSKGREFLSKVWLHVALELFLVCLGSFFLFFSCVFITGSFRFDVTNCNLY